MDAIARVLEWEETGVDRSMHEAVARRYASRAVQNLLIDRFRSRAALDSVGADASPPPESNDWSHNELAQLSEQLMGELAEPQRDLLRAYFAGSDYFREESTRQGLSAGTARVKIHRMLKRLRERGLRLHSEHGQ